MPGSDRHVRSLRQRGCGVETGTAKTGRLHHHNCVTLLSSSPPALVSWVKPSPFSALPDLQSFCSLRNEDVFIGNVLITEWNSIVGDKQHRLQLLHLLSVQYKGRRDTTPLRHVRAERLEKQIDEM